MLSIAVFLSNAVLLEGTRGGQGLGGFQRCQTELLSASWRPQGLEAQAAVPALTFPPPHYKSGT